MCDIIDNSTQVPPFVFNLTIFYTEADLRGDEALAAATSVLMFALAVLFFILNLFSRFSDGSAILNPSIRIFLSTMLSLFLPAMSYLFSEAKNQQSTAGRLEDLSVRARTILMWMLLVELLRKKVESILLTSGMQVYTHTVDRGARVVWLGSLIFFNLKSTGKKALYGILWVLAAAKVVQRFVIIELAKRSFAYRKNPRLLSAYMAEMLKLVPASSDHHHRRQKEKAAEQLQCSGSDGGEGQPQSDPLRTCNYAVMGEEDLKREPGPHGYKVVLVKPPAEGVAADDGDDSTSYAYIEDVVTVGRIWRLADTDPLLRRDPRLKRLCLSFALYKLLRRRLEDLPITHLEASNCHDLIFNGGLWVQGNAASAVALIQVFRDEIQFLCEYYHSVHPVVVASPFFFVHNYILFPIIVLALCLLMLTLCSNGDVPYALRSFTKDNYVMSTSILKMARCILSRAVRSAPYLFCSIDMSITFLLLLTFVYEEVWEVIVFLLSNWFMVSLLCSHTSSVTWRKHRFLRRVIPIIVSARNTMMGQHNVHIKQLCVLWSSRLPLPWLPVPLPLPTAGMAVVPKEAKKLIVERLARASHHAHPLSNGMPVVLSSEHRELSWACDSSGGVAEVILVWHIATSLLEARCPGRKGSQPEPGRAAATALSRYCAYLVAFHPRLLPDDKDGTEYLYAGVKRDLRKHMGWCAYYCSREVDVSNKLLDIAVQQQPQQATSKVVCRGARLGKSLIDKYKDGARESVWKLLGDIWTEVVTYVAPAGCEMHVKAHKEALAGGGEFITVLWAIATHTGITRQEEYSVEPPPSASVSCRV